MDTHLQITTTTATREDSASIAASLVTRRLAACVQVAGPITSTYFWQDKVETAHEWLCIIKTTRERYPEVEAAIKELHPYQVPEIVATEIVAGSAEYLSWLTENSAPQD